MSSILVTGATGFVGRALVDRLSEDGHQVLAAVRAQATFPESVAVLHVPTLASADTPWVDLLQGVDAVVHAAARVHVMDDQAADPLAEFRRVNVEGTLGLARAAAAAGVKRFVFLSSIKVNGEETQRGRPFRADDLPAPVDPYGISKYEAEQGLQTLASETGLEVVIIRPPLVYGPGVKANFRAMMRWLERGVPLPLGAVRDNRRSMVALGNLNDLIVTCLEHPAAANQVFLGGDGEDVSTAELLRRMARALGRPERLFPVPPGILMAGARLLGRGAVAQRLCGSLQTDVGKARELLDWKPPVSLDEGLRLAAADYLASIGRRP